MRSAFPRCRVLALLLLGVVLACAGATPDPETPTSVPSLPEGAEPVAAESGSEPVETAAATGSPVAAYLDDEEATKRGRGLFRATCSGYCHSTQPARRKAPDLFDCATDYASTDEEIFQVMYDGVPDTQMQAFGGKLPDEDLWKIIAYIRSESSCG